MKRDIELPLLLWKNDPHHLPLLIRGARQVGKSYTVEKFGKEQFAQCIIINFDLSPEYKECFNKIDPISITQSITIISGKIFQPGKTLLFLDEIQECPDAIRALRYFFEQMPELHVIGAGSLLEFALNAPDFKMPVGRVQYLFMSPLSFGEFLDSIGQSASRQFIAGLSPGSHVPDNIHDHLLDMVKQYFLTGGMPAVVDAFVQSGEMSRSFWLQTILCQTYRDDFGKYSSKIKHDRLQKIFSAVPKMVGQKFTYVKIDPDIQSRELKAALDLLVAAGIVHQVRSTSGDGVPLDVRASEKNFKCLFIDIGLMQNICGMTAQIQHSTNLSSLYTGSLAEQFAGQQLLTMFEKVLQPRLYYWINNKPGSSAEIDYMYVRGSQIFPIEVKSGKTGTLKSLHGFCKQYNQTTGIKISQAPLTFERNLLSIPFYAIETLPKLIDNI